MAEHPPCSRTDSVGTASFFMCDTSFFIQTSHLVWLSSFPHAVQSQCHFLFKKGFPKVVMAMADVVINYRPTPKQAMFHASRANEILYGGAAGGR